jgi:hypothetical protein
MDTHSASKPVGPGDYVRAGAVQLLFGIGLALTVRESSEQPVVVERLLPPMAALAGLTAIVWLIMVVFRNYAILRGISQASHYADYRSEAPPDWVERPARTFDNLFQTPLLFYVVMLLGISLRQVDQAQINLAWIYVFVRAVHAIIYIGWNHLPARFSAWIASCITLLVLWVRFAGQAWPG